MHRGQEAQGVFKSGRRGRYWWWEQQLRAGSGGYKLVGGPSGASRRDWVA